MVICPRCRKEVALGKRFCENCGLPLPPEQTAALDHKDASRIHLAKGDTGLDRSVTAIDTSAHITTNIDDRSTRQTTVATDDHSVRTRDDHSTHQQTSVAINGAGTVFLGVQPQTKVRPCPLCGMDLNSRTMFTCITCCRDVCTSHASSQSGRCWECFNRGAQKVHEQPRKFRPLVAVAAIAAVVAIIVVAWLVMKWDRTPENTLVPVPSTAIQSKKIDPETDHLANRSAESDPGIGTRKAVSEVQKETDGAKEKSENPSGGGTDARPIDPNPGLSKPKSDEPVPPRLDPAIYVNREAFSASEPTVLIVKVESGNPIDDELTSDIASAIKGTEGLFKPAFVQDGLFAKAQQNDPSILRALGLEQAASLILFGVMSATCTRDRVGGEVIFSAEVQLTIRQFLPQGGFASKAYIERAKAPAFSEAKAVQDARKALVNKIAARLAKRP